MSEKIKEGDRVRVIPYSKIKESFFEGQTGFVETVNEKGGIYVLLDKYSDEDKN